MLKIFCLFNWHTWEYKRGVKRECIHCNKRQHILNDGKEQRWVD